MPVVNFSELPIHEDFKMGIKEMGLEKMTPIQAQTIPYLLDGKDVMGAAKTGSGKTLAFLVPLVNKLYNEDFSQKCGTLAIILSPTRELSLQIFEQLTKLVSKTKLNCGLVIGGNKKEQEQKYLEKGVTILVATPGRLLDHLLNSEGFIYSNMKILVIDEADRVMDQGFMETMQAIIRRLPKDRQTMLFSATLQMTAAKMKNKMKKLKKDISSINDGKVKVTTEEKVLKLAYLSLKSNCACVDLSCQDLMSVKGEKNDGESMTNKELKQIYMICKPEDKFRLLYTFLKKNSNSKIMVFLATIHEVTFHHAMLNLVSIEATMLHGKQKNTKRQFNLQNFKDKAGSVILCTDVAARGLDIPKVDWVIQYDPPNDPKEYIHRVGRTARAGNAGQALLFLRETEIEFLTILKTNKVKVEEKKIDSANLADIQKPFEKLVADQHYLEISAVRAFKSLVQAYRTNKLPCFDVKKLDLDGLRKNFGLTYIPKIYIEEDHVSLKRNKDDSSSDEDYYIPSKKVKTKDYM